MAYCEEYKLWVDSSVESTFSIKETSANLKPTETNDSAKCEGLGFVGMYKQEDGLLMLKYPMDNENGYELVSYPEIWKIHNQAK